MKIDLHKVKQSHMFEPINMGLPLAFNLFHKFNSNIIDGEGFFKYLNKTYIEDSLNVMTFTATSNVKEHLLVPLNKVLFVIGEIKAKEVRQIRGIHAKIFIVERKKKAIAAFIGSLNLTASTSANLMIEVGRKEREELIEYFDYFWKQGVKCQ